MNSIFVLFTLYSQDIYKNYTVHKCMQNRHWGQQCTTTLGIQVVLGPKMRLTWCDLQVALVKFPLEGAFTVFIRSRKYITCWQGVVQIFQPHTPVQLKALSFRDASHEKKQRGNNMHCLPCAVQNVQMYIKKKGTSVDTQRRNPTRLEKCCFAFLRFQQGRAE